MRVRGLKLLSLYKLRGYVRVAPHAGAWIETFQRLGLVIMAMSHPMRVRGLKLNPIFGFSADSTSHPMRVRGLKLVIKKRGTSVQTVAPHAGAWIETLCMHKDTKQKRVAPHAGAWIETSSPQGSQAQGAGSHPMRVRGLKLF